MDCSRKWTKKARKKGASIANIHNNLAVETIKTCVSTSTAQAYLKVIPDKMFTCQIPPTLFKKDSVVSFLSSHLRNGALRDEWVEWRQKSWAGVLPSIERVAGFADHVDNTFGKICFACCLGNGKIAWKFAGTGKHNSDGDFILPYGKEYWNICAAGSGGRKWLIS